MSRSRSNCRTIVFGGAGFIGSYLTELLAKRGGRDILVIGRRQIPQYTLPPAVRYLCASDRQFDLESCLETADEIVDLAYASVPKTSFEDAVSDLLLNLPETVGRLQAASKFQPRIYLLVSSGGTVYGNSTRLPIDEFHPTNPVSPYGINKLAAEKYGLMYHNLLGLPIVIARPSNPYGPRQFGPLAQGFIGAAFHAIVNRKPVTVFGNKGTVRDYLYVDDLAHGIVAALESGQPGQTFNIGSGMGYFNTEVLEMIERLVSSDGFAVERHHLPERSFDVSANVLSPSFLTYASGWRSQTSLEEGLAKTWSWIRARGGA